MREIKFRVWNTKEKKMHLPFDNCSTTYNLSYFENTKHVEYPMQYTGLKDKNEVEIYEGDVIKTKYTNPQKIIFERGAFMVELIKKPGNKSYIPIKLLDRYEIIGNIYENPELTKVKTTS